MRLSVTRPMIFGIFLAIAITLSQPHLAFGAGQSFGRWAALMLLGCTNNTLFAALDFWVWTKPAISKLPFNSFGRHTDARTMGICRKQNLGSAMLGGRWGMESRDYSQDTGPFRSKGQSTDYDSYSCRRKYSTCPFLWWECGFRIQAIRARIRPSGPRF